MLRAVETIAGKSVPIHEARALFWEEREAKAASRELMLVRFREATHPYWAQHSEAWQWEHAPKRTRYWPYEAGWRPPEGSRLAFFFDAVERNIEWWLWGLPRGHPDEIKGKRSDIWDEAVNRWYEEEFARRTARRAVVHEERSLEREARETLKQIKRAAKEMP